MCRLIRCLTAIQFVVFLLMVPCEARSQEYDAYYMSDYGRRPSARMEMGISLAATYMGVAADEAPSLSPRLGVRGALVMSLCWAERYAIQLELAYLFNKIRTEDVAAGTDSGHDVRSNVMEIPLLFSLRGLGPLRVNAGPVLSLAGTARYDTEAERVEFGRMRTTVGYAAGLGVKLTKNVVIDARFTGNLGRTLNYYEGHEFHSRSYWVTLGLGYMF